MPDFQICNTVPLMKDDFDYRWLQNPYKPSVINQVDYQKQNKNKLRTIINVEKELLAVLKWKLLKNLRTHY